MLIRENERWSLWKWSGDKPVVYWWHDKETIGLATIIRRGILPNG
jgi:hypothetical protein